MSVVNDCAQPVIAGTVSASFSNGDAPLILASLRDGRWSGTWQARAAVDRVTISIRAETAAPALSATLELSGSLRANANPPPEVASGGVLNAASFRLQSPLAPGSLISIFGLTFWDWDKGEGPTL